MNIFSVIINSLLSFLTIFIIMSQGLDILSSNVQGLRDSLKRYNVLSQLKGKLKSNVYFLQETHWTLDLRPILRLLWRGDVFLSPAINPGSLGVAILLHPNLDCKVLSVDDVLAGRALKVSVSISDEIFHLINIHAPNNGQERQIFFQTLQQFLARLDPNDQIIFGGDFNCTLKPSLDRCSKQESHPRSAQELMDLIKRFDLVDPWRMHNRDKIEFSWVGYNGKSRIDKFFVYRRLLNTIRTTEYYPVTYSDHSCTIMKCSKHKQKSSSAYWCFNTSLLDDNLYIETVKTFWNSWKTEKDKYDSLDKWWDIGKSKLKLLTKQYSTSISERNKINKNALTAKLADLTNSMNNDNYENYQAVKKELNELINQEQRGAAIRSRFNMINELNTSSSYFFSLEKRIKRSQDILHLKDNDGNIITDETKIRNTIKDFYNKLYTPQPIDKNAMKNLLKDMPQIDSEAAKILDSSITLEELTQSLKSAKNNKSPGIDGIPAEFYKTFWSDMGQDLLDVINHCTEKSILPLSMRRAVLKLLPKTGDLGLLTNYRPISLLCSDYKIFTRVLASRLMGALPEIINMEQVYNVPGRKVHNNISLAKDLVYQANQLNKEFAIVSIDQAKAFDKLNHTYIFETLKAFGFGDSFISYIKMIYNDIETLINFNGNLASPFTCGRGIRQGDPASGPLYTLSVEPVLNIIRRLITSIQIPKDEKPVTSADYADDLDIFVVDDDDFLTIGWCFKEYNKASNAEVNWIKSKGLWCGAWKDREDSPLGINFNSDGLKMLGVFIGNNSEFEDKNWDNIESMINKKIDSWKGLAPILSIRGRILIVNQLAASKIMYKIPVLTPPKDLLVSLEKLFVDFIWCGKHWLPKDVLFLSIQDGGHGLIDLVTRVKTSRLLSVRDMLIGNHSVHFSGRYFLNKILDLDYDYQFFTTEKFWSNDDVELIPNVYREMLQIWSQIPKDIILEISNKKQVYEQPLIGSPRFQLSPEDTNVLKCLKISKIKDIYNGDGKLKETQTILNATDARLSQRNLQRIIKTIDIKVPHQWKQMIKDNSTTCNKDLIKEINFSFKCGTQNITCEFTNCDSTELYKFLIKYQCFTRNGYILKDSIFIKTFKGYHSESFSNIYKTKAPKHECDVAWRMLHGSVASNEFRHKIDSEISNQCNFCDATDSVIHSFIYCIHVQPLLMFLYTIYLNVYNNFMTIEEYVFNLKSSQKYFRVFNFLIVTCKYATYKSIVSKRNNLNITDPLLIFKSKIRSRLLIEFQFCKVHGKLDYFLKNWTLDNKLCKIDENDLIFNL